MHIGYLVQQFVPEVGAGPARVAEMARRWIAMGAEVTVITAMPNRPIGKIDPEYRGKLFADESWEGMRVLRSWLYTNPQGGIARTLLNNSTFMVTSGLHALLRRHRPDVLIASSPPFFPHVTGLMLSRLLDIPLVLELRDLWPDYLVEMGVLKEGLASKALLGLERYLLRRAEHCVVVTESFRKRVIEKGAPPEAVDVISNGVDTELYFREPDPSALGILEPLQGRYLVGYLGNFGIGQELTQIVEAAALVAEWDPSIHFVLAGDGPDRRRIEKKVHDLGVNNLTIFPPIPKSDTRRFYNTCDLCLVPLAPFPVLQETVPSKIFEIMACERPLLASLAGEGAAIVTASGGGRVVPPGDAQSLAHRILEVKSMPASERDVMGRKGREYVRSRYDRETLAERYLEILQGVASLGGTGFVPETARA